MATPPAPNQASDAPSKVTLTTPVTVYVAFHPASKEGRRLATFIFKWMRLRGFDAIEVGLPVYFRTLVAPATTDPNASVLPQFSPPIQLDAGHTVIVPLVDAHMVLDEHWKAALEALARHGTEQDDTPVRIVDPGRKPGQFLSVMPVMVDQSFNASGAFNKTHDPLRIWSATDTPPKGDEPFLHNDPPPTPEERAAYETEHDAWEAQWTPWVETRALRLRRGLTEAIVRHLDEAEWLRAGGRPKDRPGRLKVFISHAKADGVDIAQRIRDGLASVSRLESWFDQNDLRVGSSWADQMEEAARSSTGGMIAVVTDAYPTRPWCWRESHAAQTPVVLGTGKCDTQTIGVLPTVAVHVATDRWARIPTALARVPRIGWPRMPDSTGTSEGAQLSELRGKQAWEAEVDRRIAHIVDRLLLELVLHRVGKLKARALCAVGRSMPGQPAAWGEDWRVLTFPPDPRTLGLAIQGDRSNPTPASSTVQTVVYPGHGLRTGERATLALAIPKSLRPRLLSFDQVLMNQVLVRTGQDPISDSDGCTGNRPPIAVSTSGSDADLLPLGYSTDHILDFTVRLSRLLLQMRYRVAYGGSLQLAKTAHNLTRALLDTAEGWQYGSPGEWGVASTNAPTPSPKPPLVNYAAWWYSLGVTTAIQARYASTCAFIPVYADGTTHLTARQHPNTPTFTANSLTAMREKMAKECSGRIVLGGKVHGSAGWIPGIAEEVLTTIEAGHPVLVFAKAGGCAGLLGEWFKPGSGPTGKKLGKQAVLDALAYKGGGTIPPTPGSIEEARSNHHLEMVNRLQAASETVKTNALVTVSTKSNTTAMLADVVKWLRVCKRPRS